MSGDFTPEQKRYLEGFVAGVQARGGKVFWLHLPFPWLLRSRGQWVLTHRIS
jgi:hypothetical protein